ncbi:PDZ domain-containing protein 8 [Stomoxys calcitrans]|uniref:PDZ domain-containing protein 8 n=1 Tax=Stomoxys calcitrans TaxID=35570 RepID=A0A1I8PFI6_STOCA|nr:PDZ domain-containing protein 8 [Stomoxys calcitrans]
MDINLSMLILLSFTFFIIGAVFMLLFQYYVYLKFSLLPEETAEQKDINAKYTLPKALHQTARSINQSPTGGLSQAAATLNAATSGSASGSSAKDADASSLMSLNFVMQFLFHELKNSNRVRKWFYRKLSLELDELIAKTTTGKLFDKLTIKQLELGDQFPEIKTLRVHNIELDESGERIENLDLLMEIHYMGNFRTSIDADMVLGKKGSLTLKVKQLSGLARLQFTRNPYTHWSLSFLGDPELDLAIESRYQGRQMQSNITSLISNQIRKAVRRKHTLPNYKLRYKPFFHKTPEEDVGEGDIQPNGVLEVKVSEISRLMCPTHLTDIYCTITMASLAFVEAWQQDDRHVKVSLDVEIHKAKNQQIGIIFKQSAADCVEIEAVLPNTPACKSNLKVGDILLAIEGKRVSTIQQVAKVIKSLQANVFCLRIDRVIPGIIRNDAILEDLDIYEDLGDARSGYSTVPVAKTPEPVAPSPNPIRSLAVAEKSTSSESSLSNTPTNSPKKTKLIAKALKKTISRDHGDGSSKDDEGKAKLSKLAAKQQLNLPKVPSRTNCESLLANLLPTTSNSAASGVNDVEHYYQHSTVDCKLSHLIHMEDVCNFKLDPHCKFLNISVYGKSLGENQLLGFTNIPIYQILAECCETSLSQSFKAYELNPPMPEDLKNHHLSAQSGFNPNLCFGDILFAFTWDGNPNLSATETPSKHQAKLKSKSITSVDKTDDSGYSDNISIKSTDTIPSQPRAHNFVRTHFQRATQCDFCGKKIWLKDAMQCRECFMCCHKKCINKCQNATVCGPVDCSSALQQQTPLVQTPEFMVTEPDIDVAVEPECDGSPNAADGCGAVGISKANAANNNGTTAATTPGNLEVHRSSLTGLLAQGIKRVNSANNLAIPGIVSTIAGVTTSNTVATGGGGMVTPSAIAKSLPPSPQHTPSRKSSLVPSAPNTFDLVTHRLESLPVDVPSFTPEQVVFITEHIIQLSRDEDVMSLAKNASRQLYSNVSGSERVEKINLLLTKLRLALDSETAIHSNLAASIKNGNNENINTTTTPSGDGINTQHQHNNKSNILGKSEERIQALSVIMLYLCTGLQHAQGVAMQ